MYKSQRYIRMQPDVGCQDNLTIGSVKTRNARIIKTYIVIQRVDAHFVRKKEPKVRKGDLS